MADREHTDRQALEEMLKLPPTASRISNPGRLWAWIEEQFWKEKVPAHPPSDPVARRLRVYRVGLRYARRLARIDQGEAAEILGVTAMLLGIEPVVRAARRPREVRRA